MAIEYTVRKIANKITKWSGCWPIWMLSKHFFSIIKEIFARVKGSWLETPTLSIKDIGICITALYTVHCPANSVRQSILMQSVLLSSPAFSSLTSCSALNPWHLVDPIGVEGIRVMEEEGLYRKMQKTFYECCWI